jgi:serine/threonine protein kinase
LDLPEKKAMSDVKELRDKIIDDYKLNEYLGYTGVAHVYTSAHVQTGNIAAVHLLPNIHVNEPNFMEAYIMKAAQLQRLTHPNIVRTLSYGIGLDHPYLVMAHIEGPTLKDLLNAVKRRMRRIPLDAGVFIINSLAGALSQAHQVNLTHSNLKPTNVLLEKSGMVMLTDFGLPQLVAFDPGALFDPLGTNLSAGQNIQREKLRDLFDLGLMSYQIATGQSAYNSSDTDGLENLSKAELAPPSSIVPEIPDNLDNVIVRMITPHTAHRYQSVKEMLVDLTEISRKVKTTVLPSARLTDVAQFSSRFARAVVPEEVETEKAKNAAIYFLDTGQVVELENNREYTLGRLYEGQPIHPDIDLTPFKGYEWGISRLHASLRTTMDQIYVTDLGSANGTYHAGERLEPNSPHLLSHGDIIMLGKLRLQIMLPIVGGSDT